MKLAVIMPNESQKKRIDALREELLKLMPFQRDHFYHLVRSWGVTSQPNGLAVMEEALKRTLRDKPYLARNENDAGRPIHRNALFPCGPNIRLLYNPAQEMAEACCRKLRGAGNINGDWPNCAGTVLLAMRPPRLFVLGLILAPIALLLAWWFG